MVDLVGFGLSAAVNGAIALVVFSIFCWCRIQPKNRFVYEPRAFHPAFRGGRPPPPPISASYFAWIWEVIRVDRSTFISSAGLDAYMFIRFLELCAVLFAGMIVLGVGVIVPVNYTAQGGQDGFDAISVSNIPNNSARLAAHVIVAYIFAAWTYFLLYLVWLEYRQLRVAYLTQEHLSNRGMAVLVQGIPQSACNDATLLSTFRSRLPPASSFSASSSALLAADADGDNISAIPKLIHSAYIVKDTGKMPDAVSDRDDALNGLEHAVLAYEQNPDERPRTATRCFCCAKKDALTHFEDEMSKQDALLAEGRDAAINTHDGFSNGFITFDSVQAYQTALRSEKSSQLHSCRPAPEPRDVYWPSLSYTPAKRLYMTLIVAGLLYLLVFFWIVPVAFTQSIANLSSIAKSGSAFGWLDFVNDIPTVVLGIIDGFLPGLILTIFNILLPMILYKLSKLEGIEAVSWLQFSVLDKYTIFQVINNFFFTTVSTAIMADPSDLLQSSLIVNTLGQSIPQTSTFFITYLLFNSFSVYPMALLNPGGLIVGRLKKRFLMKTGRDLINIEAAPARDYGTSYPILIFAFIITITFSVIAPIVLPFAVLYYVFAYVSNKFSHLYVYNTAFETGGQFWPVICRKMCWCIFSGQLVFTALLGIKKAPAPAVISGPLIILPYIFIFFVERAFLPTTELLPVDAAAAIDAEREKRRVLKRGATRTPFLDESSILRDYGYDQCVIRARGQKDIIYRHNTCTPDKAEEYHRNALQREEVRTQKTRMDEKKTGPVEIEKIDTDSYVASRSEATLSSSGSSPPFSASLSHDDRPPLTTQASSSSTELSTIARIGQLVHAYHPQYSTVQQTLVAGAGLGALPPPQDYVQPELLAPAKLPIPRHVPAVTPDDSVGDNPKLYDEVSDEALERNARRTDAATAGDDGPSDAEAPTRTEAAPTTATTAGDGPDPEQVVVHH